MLPEAGAAIIHIDFSSNLTDKALAQYEDLFSDRQRAAILRAVGARVGVAAESLVPEYPPASRKPLPLFYDRTDVQGRPYKSKFKSAKQQRYVMALARKGKIPYRRTGQLGRSLTSRVVRVTPQQVDVSIGTNLTYGPYVKGKPPVQSHYHTGVWTSLEDDIQKGRALLASQGSDALLAEILKRLK